MDSSSLQIKLTGHTNKDDIQVEMLSRTDNPKIMRQVRSGNVTNRLYLEAMELVETPTETVWIGKTNKQQQKNPTKTQK